MATTTPTIRTTTTTFVSCAAESGRADAFSFRSLYRAWLACRKRKRGTRNAQRYEIRLLDRLVDTRAALAARTWSPGRSVCFVTTHPKAREIHAADFADRVVHHLLVPRLEALYEPVFIHDSYSNRIGKGTHAAVDRLQTFMRRVTRNGARRAWYLQLDIRNFFNTIDRHSLLDQLLRRIGTQVSVKRLDPGEAEQLAWLCRSLLDKHPAEDVVHRGDPRSFARVPEHKRLSAAPPGKGLPIGNLTSQFFANVYLNELDQFVKHTLKCRCYVRYVDDFVLLHEDRARLIEWRDAIRNFLTDQLELDLKHDGILRPVANGADFLGYIARPDYRLVRRRVIGHLRERLDGISRLLVKEDAKGCSLVIRKEHREALRATLASYWGHFHHADTHRLINALWCRYPWLGELFRLSENDRLVPLWEPASVTSLRSQWRWFKSQRPADLLLMQVGNVVRVFGAEKTVAWAERSEARGSACQACSRASLRSAQATLIGGVSLPLHRLQSLRQRLRQRRVAHCFVAEEGYLKLGMKRRVLRLVWRPIPAVGVRGVQTCHA